MKDVDLYLKVRHAVRIEGLSERAAARRFGIDPRTVNKMMKFSVPPGYVRKKPPAKPKLDPFIPVIDRILGDGKSQRTRVFAELQSHYLFEDRFGRPGKGNDKGKVEGLVGYARRNFLVPIPVFESFEALNAYLLECCRRRMTDCLRGHDATIGERLERDLAALQTPLPAPYDACEKVATTISSLSLVRYRLNDYSVPTSYG